MLVACINSYLLSKRANAQLINNVLGVLLFIWFVPWIARGLERLIPDKPQQEQQTA